MNRYEKYMLDNRTAPHLHVGLEVKLRDGQRFRITGTDGEGRFWGVPTNNPPHSRDTQYSGWAWDSNGVYQDGVCAHVNINMEAI